MQFHVASTHAKQATPPQQTTLHAEPTNQQESAVHRAGHWLDAEISRPGIAAAIAGTAIVIAAATAGVAEAALGGAGAYLVYRIAKRRQSKREKHEKTAVHRV